MRIHKYDSLSSTNIEAARISAQLCHGDIITAYEQTAGRGQRGNTWESEPGKNLTFSQFLRPENLAAADSFLLSMAVSVAVMESLNKLLFPEIIKIKWPNDIYWADRKLAGILIENSLSGCNVERSIVGIGLNVNQTVFHSDAPNPVSMINITGKEFFLDDVLHEIGENIIKRTLRLHDSELSDIYHAGLWRREGRHLWKEPSGNIFTAEIVCVEPTGHLVLKDDYGRLHTYAFKEVFPVL